MSVFKRWNGTSWEIIGPQISSTRFDDTNYMIAPEYSSTDIYNVGDYVVQSDNLYKCISAIESAEEWTAAHWTQVSVSEEISDLNSALNSYIYKDENNLFANKMINYHKTVNSTGEIVDSEIYDYVEVPVTQGTEYIFDPAPRFLRLKVGNSIADNQGNMSTYTPNQSGTLYCILYDSLINTYKMYTRLNDPYDILPIGKRFLSEDIIVRSVESDSFVKPQDYGAVGDGVADDTAAFQKAIERSYNRTLLVPYGVYNITSPLVIEKPIIIQGIQESARQYSIDSVYYEPETYIKAGAYIDEVFFIKSSYVTIKNIAIDADSKATYALYSDDTKYISRINLESVHVKSAINDGFHICMYLSLMRLCTAYECGRRGFSLGSSTGANMTSTTIESCYADNCPMGFYINHYVYSSMISCAVDNSTNAYEIRSSSIVVQSCGCERAANPMYIPGNQFVKIIDFYAANVKNKNGQNTNNAIIRTSGRTNKLIISGLRLEQLDSDDSRGVQTYKGYKLFIEANRVDQVSILDDSIKYAEIFIDISKFPQKYPVSFPNERSKINNLITLAGSIIDEVSCEKVHNGEFLLTVTEVNTQARTKVFGCAVVTLEPGLYEIKGTEETTETQNYGISVGTSGYGNGIIGYDGGETGYFELNEETKVYIALQMKPNELRTVRFIPEIIKIV